MENELKMVFDFLYYVQKIFGRKADKMISNVFSVLKHKKKRNETKFFFFFYVLAFIEERFDPIF